MSIRWTNGARCAVTLSFDVDGESPWIYRDKALAEERLRESNARLETLLRERSLT